MNYYEICVQGKADQDLLTGILSLWPFESFMETDLGLCAYMPENVFSEGIILEIEEKLEKIGKLQVTVEFIQEQNWNEEWEKNFQPVVINDFCCIKADFHKVSEDVKYTLTVNPKMAFGTGHHETTWMMIEHMSHLDIRGKKVFDYGTGTGILAILAHKMGASLVDAIDYDKNSVENAYENSMKNNIEELEFHQCELSGFDTKKKYDIILANINFPVLIENALNLTKYLTEGSILLLSGLLLTQVEKVSLAYLSKGFTLIRSSEKGDWACLEWVYSNKNS